MESDPSIDHPDAGQRSIVTPSCTVTSDQPLKLPAPIQRVLDNFSRNCEPSPAQLANFNKNTTGLNSSVDGPARSKDKRIKGHLDKIRAKIGIDAYTAYCLAYAPTAIYMLGDFTRDLSSLRDRWRDTQKPGHFVSFVRNHVSDITPAKRPSEELDENPAKRVDSGNQISTTVPEQGYVTKHTQSDQMKDLHHEIVPGNYWQGDPGDGAFKYVYKIRALGAVSTLVELTKEGWEPEGTLTFSNMDGAKPFIMFPLPEGAAQKLAKESLLAEWSS